MSKYKAIFIAIISFFLVVSPAIIQAQDSYLKGRWNFKLTGAPEREASYYSKSKYFMVEADYGIVNNLEVGLALTAMQVIISSKNPAEGSSSASNFWFYHPAMELSLNFHPLTFFIKDKVPRFDLYVSGRGGAVRVSNKYNASGTHPYYQIGGGAGYYFTRHIGVYSEYNYQPKDISFNTSGLRFGVAVKF